ncbi:hypothetical protein [Faecalibaculum rodentium]|uniref:hypothetical protein n=1 Tax=Faecalibaculum rodentium TaxID=1702221 RepID=UPI0026129EB1|nr:hypothetical protein [Faecalibaculum rodentium]
MNILNRFSYWIVRKLYIRAAEMEFSLIAVKPGDLEKENHSPIEEKGLIRKLLLRMCEGNGIISELQAVWINQQVITHKRTKSSKNVLTDSCG